MIQYNAAARQVSSSVGLIARRNTVNDGPDQWAKWIGRRQYSLEVTQHPIRARMCGFGDKDRRPLAPAAVAKLVVREEDNSLVDLDDIDISFFVVTVDLWSEDGKQEMNLVLHPSSNDRYPPPPQPIKQMPRRRGTASSTASAPPAPSMGPPPLSRTTSSDTSILNIGRHGSENETTTVPMISSYHTHPSFPYDDPAHSSDSPSFAPSFGDSSHPTWGYGPQPTPGLPPSSSDGWGTPSGAKEDETAALSFRPWSSDISLDGSLFGSSHQSTDTMWNAPSSSSSSQMDDNRFSGAPDLFSSSTQHQPPHYDQSAYSSPFHPQSSLYPHSAYSTPSQVSISQHSASAGPSSAPSPLPSDGPTLPTTISPPSLPRMPSSVPRHLYTRTLVGPLSANASRLLDEHRKPGIFFLFQDLSVRTEGTFRLRMRLMNIGAPPAPEPGATVVHSDISPVLAQVFTDPFIVYSAKRFPGVPDTTALSIAFGNQGQKLPIRNRHGSGKSGRRRRGGDSDSDDDD
ncbi:velvet factor [Pterulicium gracile]|uniref:Velvet factor n=1 Tax=Pterulicium gracile TaxID=1884261 RepID=A0A5C3QC35_9AGAR|nr:velvet factor [Pterula gracilis]